MDVDVGGYFGPFLDSHNSAGVLGGAGAALRHGWLETGGFIEYGSAMWDYEYFGVGGTLGPTWRAPFGLRLTLAAAAGEHMYSSVGRGFLSSDPGVSGNAAFLGAHAAASYLFGRGRVHAEVGLIAFYDDDVTRNKVASDYDETNWFGGGTQRAHTVHELGTSRGGVALRLSAVGDLL